MKPQSAPQKLKGDLFLHGSLFFNFSQPFFAQEIISLYYEWSPVIVKSKEEDEEFNQDLTEKIDGVLELITKEAE